MSVTRLSMVVALILPGCASGGSPQGIGNVGGQGQQGLGLVQQNPDDSSERQAHSAGDVDQSSRLTWNDVRPWLFAQTATVLIVALVVMYWIRHNSYARQKPAYEKSKGRSCDSSHT